MVRWVGPWRSGSGLGPGIVRLFGGGRVGPIRWRGRVVLGANEAPRRADISSIRRGVALSSGNFRRGEIFGLPPESAILAAPEVSGMPDLLSRPLNDPQLSIWVEGFISFVLWIGLFWIAKRILFSALRRVALRTSWSWDDVLVRALSLPTSIAIAASVLLLLDRILPLSP